MKIIKALFITIIILVLLAGIGAYVFVKNFNINQYKPQIIAELGKQLGRPVAIDNLGLNVSLFNGVYAQAQGIKIAEDAQFGSGDFVNVGQVQLKVDVMAYLTRHEIVISSVLVDAPVIQIIRDENGLINATKIGPAGSATAASAASAPAANPSTATAPALPNFTVETITIANGKVLFIDKSVKPAMQITISGLTVNVKDFSLTKAFGFDVSAMLFANTSNINVHGQAAINATTQEATLTFVQIDTDLSKIQIAELIKTVPALEAAGLQGNIDGKISVQIPSLNAGPKGLGALSFNGRMDGGKISTKLLPVPVEKIAANFTGDEKNINITNFSLALSTGNVNGTAKITDYLATQGLALDVKVDAIPLMGLVGNLPEGIKIVGGLNADLKVSGENLSNPDKFLNSLNGSGQFNIKDGKLENFNVIKVVISRIPVVSGLLNNLVESGIPEKYKDDFVRNDTIFKEFTSSIKIASGNVNLPDIHISSDLFDANMNVSADPKLNGKFGGQVKFSADLSKYMSAGDSPLQYLRDEEGRVVIPFEDYEGPLANLKVMPKVKDLTKTAVVGEGRKQLDKLLDKALGVPSSAPQTEGEGAAPAEERISPEKELIHGLLDKILK